MRCMRVLVATVVAAMLLPGPIVFAQIYDRSLESLRLRAEVDGENNRDYRVDIYEPVDGSRHGWLLEMRCTNCKEEYVYQEVIDDYPIRIFPIGAHYLVTEWSSAVATIVRLYHLGNEVRLALHHGVRGGAEYTLAEDGKTPTMIFDYVDEPWKDKPKMFREIWKWNGAQFVKTSTRCIQNCRR